GLGLTLALARLVGQLLPGQLVIQRPPGRLLRFCRLLLQTLQRPLFLDRPLSVPLGHRLLPLRGAQRLAPPRPRSRARRGAASSTRTTFSACRSPLVSAISKVTSSWAQRP